MQLASYGKSNIDSWNLIMMHDQTLLHQIYGTAQFKLD